MAAGRSTLEITYNGTGEFPLEVHLGYRQTIAHVFTNGETLDVTDICAPSELNRDSVFAGLVQAGTFSVTITAGDDDITEPAPLLTSSAGADITTTPAIAGVAVTAARADHTHILGAASIVAANIASDAVTAAKILADAVTTVKILDANVTTAKLASASVTPVKFSVADSDGIAGALVLRKVLTASGATGAADDVTIFSSNAPFKFRVVDAVMVTSTAAAGSSTAALRTASGGAGTLLSGAMAIDANGVSRPTGTSMTATSTVASAGSLFLRRSDRAQVGEILITIIRET